MLHISSGKRIEARIKMTTDTFTLGTRPVKRLGYGAMQLAGPHVFGPPKDRDAALAVLREAIASGVNHIDTSDFYGPHVPIRMIWSSSPRSARGAAKVVHGFLLSRVKNLLRRCMTICATSAWMRLMWSICAPCLAFMALPKAPSKRRSR